MLIPKILTLVATTTAFLLITLLVWTAWRHRNPPVEAPSAFAGTATNRWLIGMRAGFGLLAALVLGVHFYWAFWADSNPRFAQAKTLDARNRRLSESGLKGWVLDRSRALDKALIRYRADGGVITREYPLGPAAVHLTGYSDFIYGSGGIEHAYREWLTEAASTYNALVSPVPVGKDLAVSIDAGLQREVFDLLERTGRPAAAVVLLLPNNEVLAMASTPSFDPLIVRDEAEWRRLSEQAETTPELSPLVNRAIGRLVTGGPAHYYRPGSTFKVFTAAVAVDSRITEERFTCKPSGFVAPGVTRPIRDFENEVHGRIGLDDAFRLSCNQYFAQLGLKLGKERLAGYARRLGLVTEPNDKASRVSGFWNIVSGNTRDVDFIFGPPPSRMDLSRTATAYDVSLQAFGQGFDDVTVLQMAVLVSALAHPDGVRIAPALEVDAKPKATGPFVAAESAARLRRMMRSVVESGTAAGPFAPLLGRITAGGKTGTADRDVTLPQVDASRPGDQRSGRRTVGWTDSWFVGFAPADHPRIAYAVIVENGGAGARSAAPVAVKLIERAAARGYLKAAGRKG